MLPPCNHFSYPNLLSTFANHPFHKPTHTSHTVRPFLKPTHPSETNPQPFCLPGDDCRTYGRLTDPKKNHPQNPSVKSMVPPAPRECHQPARSALHRKQFAAHRPAQRIGLRIPCITAHRANATSPRASHRIANNPRTVQRAARTYNQPAAHRPQRTAHTSHLQLCTRFAVLCARLFGSWD